MTKTVVITGSTRGIGLGLADAFLARDCQVVVSGRTAEAVARAVEALSVKHDPERVFGHPCDVTRFEQVQSLWNAALSRFGAVDIWVNNAGIAHPQTDVWAYTPEQIRSVIETNAIGAWFGARVAVKGMLNQGWGSFYNMEGLGSEGRYVEGLALYGATKQALTYLTDALVRETEGTPILVGALRPGMVVTGMLTTQYEDRPEDWESAKRVFNILADKTETVTPWLADKILGNEKRGARFKWLSRTKVLGRFLTSPFRRRDLFGS